VAHFALPLTPAEKHRTLPAHRGEVDLTVDARDAKAMGLELVDLGPDLPHQEDPQAPRTSEPHPRKLERPVAVVVELVAERTELPPSFISSPRSRSIPSNAPFSVGTKASLLGVKWRTE
jgi:hypothetical protein